MSEEQGIIESVQEQPPVNRGGRPRKDGSPARPRRNMPQTAGRPASPAMVDTVEEPRERRIRRSRLEGNFNDFEIPESIRRRFRERGLDLQWGTTSIMGMPVDGAEQTRAYEAGWRPVNAKDARELCPPGWERPTVERYGQILYERPLHLTAEAKEEDIAIAERQKQDKLQQSLAAPAEQHRGVQRRVTEFSIEGEVGVHAEKPR